MENGVSPSRIDAFPIGLRVLVVDDDPTWLKILEKMLKKCSYQVTTCGLARDALHLLRERKDGFDIVISDVNMPDMDGFILLELLGLEMDLPVIMMSVDGETRRVMKGVQHGACDYLLKPIRMKELRNIWQHVLRKRIHEVRDIETYDNTEEFQMLTNESDHCDDGHLLLSGDSTTLVRKRKDIDVNKNDANEVGAKKARIFWTIDLHQQFVRAVNQIGLDKVGPKKILDLMNIPWLTRENVASHLQKYRLYLSRLQKDNDFKISSNAAMHSDSYPKIPTGKFGIQNSANMLQSCYASTNYGLSAHKFQESSVIADENRASFNFSVPTQHVWVGKKSEIQLKKEHTPASSITYYPFRAERENLDLCSAFGFPRKDSQVHWLDNDYCGTNIELRNINFLDYNDPELSTDFPFSLHDDPRFDCDYSVEFPILDQRLFA